MPEEPGCQNEALFHAFDMCADDSAPYGKGVQAAAGGHFISLPIGFKEPG